MPLLVIGTSHQSAALEFREKLAVAEADYASVVTQLCEMPAVDEAIIVSTCNRTEVYAIVLPEDEQCILNWLKNKAGLDETDGKGPLYQHVNEKAVEHLFKVASGLDSLVLGEAQISGQLKSAWQAAHEAGGAGKLLDRLFQHAFGCAKTVRHLTGINDHPVSVAYITMLLARQIFGHLSDKNVLLIGAGEMVHLCGRHLHEQGVATLMIANRTLSKAEALATEFGATAHPLSEVSQLLPRIDILVTSTASREPILHKAEIEHALVQRRRKPIFLVDIAVPRDIHPEAAELQDVFVYTIDDLQKVADDNVAERHRAAASAQTTIDTAVQEYMRWLHGARAAKFLQRLRQHAVASSEELSARALRQLRAGRDPEQVVTQLASTLTNKILHVPSKRLREAAESQEYDLLKAADRLFDRSAGDEEDVGE